MPKRNIHMVGSLIGCAGGQVSFAMPPRPGEVMTKAEALEFAAWIVAAAMPEDGEFERVLEEVRNT